MKIEITTTPKTIELTNMVLARAIESLENNTEVAKVFGLSINDIEKVKKFREDLLKCFLGR